MVYFWISLLVAIFWAALVFIVTNSAEWAFVVTVMAFIVSLVSMSLSVAAGKADEQAGKEREDEAVAE